jgi:CelD/BcsL family acetyltransferase involved in cellulose biosynthesis
VLKVKELNDYAQFSGLQTQWNEVLSKSNSNNVFLTWEWLSTWWKHFGKDRELAILLAMDNGEIVAAAPLMRSNYDLLGFKFKKMEFLGAEHTDVRNFILTNPNDDCIKLFLNYLCATEWDFLEFRDIPENRELAGSLRKVFWRSLLSSERVSNICFYIPLYDSVEEFNKTLGGDMRRSLRRRMKRLREQYDVTFEQFDSVKSAEEGVKELVYLHQKKWKSKGQEGSFGRDPRFAGFLRDIAKAFSENGWLNLSFLKADGEAVSAALCFEYNRVMYYYHPGYDPAFAKFGVGNLLLMHLIEEAIGKGMQTFDFLHGVEPYKKEWTSLSYNNLEFGCKRNHILPILYDKVIRSKEYDWIKNSDSEYLRKIKINVRKSFPSLYAALS